MKFRRIITCLIAVADCLCIFANPHFRHVRMQQADSIMQYVYKVSPLYSQIVDEYTADLYLKGWLRVHRRNELLRYVPAMFQLDKNVKDYLLETVSELHFTAPDIIDRKMKAYVSTLPRNRGQITDMMDYLNMNVYSTSLLSGKLLSPLDAHAAQYYRFVLDSVSTGDEGKQYKIRIEPRYRGTQLVSGYMWVSDQTWSLREFRLKGQYDVIHFDIHVMMGRYGKKEFLPVQFDLGFVFKFLGNHLEMNCNALLNYREVKLNDSGQRRRSANKHRHDLTESYRLVCDTAALITDRDSFATMRPLPLSVWEDELYRRSDLRRDTLRQAAKSSSKSMVFWGQVGDMLLRSYTINLQNLGQLRTSPLINPLLLDYSPRRGISYRQKFHYNKLYSNGCLLSLSPQVGYNFTHRELYLKLDGEWNYWPEKRAGWEVNVGNGNRIYSSVVLDQLRQSPDSLMNFDNMELDYFKDVYFNLLHRIEPVNGLFIKAGVSMHWRSLIRDQNLESLPGAMSRQMGRKYIQSRYNTVAPRVRIEWTPGMYYYMNGRRKINVRSSFPTFTLDYERGLKRVFHSNTSSCAA